MAIVGAGLARIYMVSRMSYLQNLPVQGFCILEITFKLNNFLPKLYLGEREGTIP